MDRSMNFPDVISQRVKPELNHIYTERPTRQSGGLDCGWYCREHALHLYCLATLMGKTSEICLGDFVLHRPGGDSYHSVGDDSDHAWCRIDDCAIVDASMTVRHLYPDIPDIALVYGNRPDLAPGFVIDYRVNAPDEQFRHLVGTDRRVIGYNEKRRLGYSATELLSDPFRFLFRPPPGRPTMQEIYGADVFYAITHHCYRLVVERTKPLHHYRDPKGTVAQILKYNPNAKDSIEALLV